MPPSLPLAPTEAPVLQPRDKVPTRCPRCGSRVYHDPDVTMFGTGRADSITCLMCGSTVAWLPMLTRTERAIYDKLRSSPEKRGRPFGGRLYPIQCHPERRRHAHGYCRECYFQEARG